MQAQHFLSYFCYFFLLNGLALCLNTANANSHHHPASGGSTTLINKILPTSRLPGNRTRPLTAPGRRTVPQTVTTASKTTTKAQSVTHAAHTSHGDNSADHGHQNTVNQQHGGGDHDKENHGDSHDSHETHGDHYGDPHGDEGHHVDGEHGEDHSGGKHGDHGDHEEGGHHVPPPSYQLDPHTYSYKPEGFELHAEEIGIRAYLVSFDYPVVNEYDRYMIRVRFHGHPEFATSKLRINKTDSNELILKNFIEASYVICVSLFSSSGLPEYPALSTSDMCIDLVVGEQHPIGAHHGSTGLLSPLLMAVAAVLLFIIAVGTKIKKAYLKRAKKSSGHGGENGGGDEHGAQAKQRERGHSVSLHGASDRRASKMEKSQTEQRLDDVLRRDSEPKWRAAANLCKIVNSDSAYDQANYQNGGRRRTYDNRAYDYDYDYEEDDDDLLSESEFYDEANSETRSYQMTSIQSLSHVLDNKPWVTRQQQHLQRHPSQRYQTRDSVRIEKF
jgi:hypothetical protein